MRIFISPLDWGLGHAARCIPIIRYLLEKKIEVVIGAEGKHLIFLKEHFPKLEYVEFPGYQISYSKYLPVSVKVLLQLPKMLTTINKEHQLLSQIIEEKKIDAIISDNRYGLWNKEVPCVIISHQLNIQAPFGSSILNKIIHKQIKYFNECWIPDYEDEGNLSGSLSHPIPEGINGKYIGPLSRFDTSQDTNQNVKYDILAILSGPEPQRSILEGIILKELKETPSIKALIIQGLPGKTIKQSGLENVEMVPHLTDTEFESAINSSEIILCRAGYSTLMDLHAIGWKKSIFIPTPGQTEQEYFSEMLAGKGMAVTYRQSKFSLKKAFEKARQLNPTPPSYGKEKYKEVIDAWIEKIDR